MKLISKTINVLLVIGILFTVIAAIGTAITKKPVLLSVIRSNSMYPVWQKGDMVLIENLNEEDTVQNGDIIFFKTEKGSLADKGWIAHRIMDGDAEKGFTTQGDANERTDQLEGSGLIVRGSIAGRAFTIGSKPIVFPKIGYLALWAEKYQKSPYALPVIAVVLSIIIAVAELTNGKKKRKKKSGMEIQLIYIIGGLTISIIIGASMVASGQKMSMAYEVSEASNGVLMGSNVGILKVGDEVKKPLADLSNNGFFTLIGTITTNDNHIHFSHTNVSLSPGETVEAEFTLTAKQVGKYKTGIQVGLFYPLLPSSLIYYLAGINYWLALATVSLIPGLPLMAYPIIDGKMRRGLLRVFRKKRTQLFNRLQN